MPTYREILRELPQLNKAIADFATEDPYPRKPSPRLRAINAFVWVSAPVLFVASLIGFNTGIWILFSTILIAGGAFLWSLFYRSKVKALREPVTATERRAIEVHKFAEHAKERWSGKRLRRSLDPSVAAMLELIASAYYSIRSALEAEGFSQLNKGAVFEEARLHALSAAKDSMAEAILIAKPYFGNKQNRTKSGFTSALESLFLGDMEEAFEDFVSEFIDTASDVSRGTSAAFMKYLKGVPTDLRARLAAEQELAEFVGSAVANRKTEPEIVALNNILSQMRKLFEEVQKLRLKNLSQNLVDDSAVARLEHAINNLEQIRLAEEEIRSGL